MGRLSCVLSTSLAVSGLQSSDKVKSHKTRHLSGVGGGSVIPRGSWAQTDSRDQCSARGWLLWKSWGQGRFRFFLMITSKDICPVGGPRRQADGSDFTNFPVLQVQRLVLFIEHLFRVRLHERSSMDFVCSSPDPVGCCWFHFPDEETVAPGPQGIVLRLHSKGEKRSSNPGLADS